MSFIVYDLKNLYNQTFYSKPYQVNAEDQDSFDKAFVVNASPKDFSQSNGSQLTDKYKGKDVWLPVKFVNLEPKVFGASEILLPYVTVRISNKKNIVKTSVAERSGTVKELYSIDDYSIEIKGFLIDDENRVWPEAQILQVKKFFEYPQSLNLDNALTNLFLGQKDNEDHYRVSIESFDLPEVSGGRKHIRPFSMKCESDSVFTLEL